MSKSLIFGLLFSILMLFEGAKSIDVPVTTSKGPIVGTMMNGANVFRGVPFANPPILTLRFMPPQPKNTWTTPLQTKAFGNFCYQQAALGTRINNGNHLHGMGDTASAPFAFSEDCLYLNVYSQNISMMAKKPVMVFIHGGSYLHGSGALYGGPGTINNIVNRGVVVVTINYRLGVFGFFSTQTSQIPGNYGLLDQIIALKWVQTEISRFGGDPTRVTIFGESAGSSSVSILTLSPMARGLFQNAIMQSGSAFMPWAVSGNNNINYHSSAKTALQANCTNWNSQLLKCLQQIPTKALYKAAVAAVGDILVWQPTMDGPNGVIPDTLTNLAKTRPTNVSLLMGTNHDETAGYWLTAFQQNKYFISNFTKILDIYAMSNNLEWKTRFGTSMTQVVSILKLAYIDSANPPIPPMAHKQWLDLIIQIYSGYDFFYGTVMDLQMALAYGNKNVYVYSFDYKSDSLPYPQGYKCTPHAFDLPFLFQNPVLSGVNWSFSKSDREISTEFGELWTSFAINRKPTIPNSRFNWQPINATNPDQFLSINIPSVFKQSSYHRRSSNLWNVVIPSVFGATTKGFPINYVTITLLTWITRFARKSPGGNF